VIEYAVDYEDTEPVLHVATCGDLKRRSPNWYFDADTVEAAINEVADSYALDLDLFDGSYETVEAARELSVPSVNVKPCVTKGAK
jgi:hypothetical protein